MKMNKKNITILVLAIIYFIAALFLIDGEPFTRINRIVILPFYLGLEVCYFLIPITFVLLVGLTITQLVRKDYTSCNGLFELLVFMNYLGHLNGHLDYVLRDYTNFLSIDFFHIDILFVIFLGVMLGADYIYKKKDTRYYLIFTIPLVVYMLGYMVWIVKVGI